MEREHIYTTKTKRKASPLLSTRLSTCIKSVHSALTKPTGRNPFQKPNGFLKTKLKRESSIFKSWLAYLPKESEGAAAIDMGEIGGGSRA